MIAWLDTIVQGILLGGLYALYATGLSLIFGIMRLVNLAHGDLIIFAAFLILALVSALGLDTVVAFAIAVPIMFVVGYAPAVLSPQPHARQRHPAAAARHLRPVDHHPERAAGGLFRRHAPASDRRASPASRSRSAAASRSAIMPLLSLIAAILVVVLLNQLFYRTALGRAFRATSDDSETAQLMGIDNNRIYATAMGLAMAVCAVAAFFLGSRATFDPTIGPARLIYAFEAVIIGGLGSLWGTLAGGMVVGIAQTIGARINPEWQILAGHLAFLVVLVLRPRGFFPRAVD